jgi:hypothetical protein
MKCRYVTKGKELLSQLKTGDIIKSAKLVSGLDRFVAPTESGWQVVKGSPWHTEFCCCGFAANQSLFVYSLICDEINFCHTTSAAKALWKPSIQRHKELGIYATLWSHNFCSDALRRFVKIPKNHSLCAQKEMKGSIRESNHLFFDKSFTLFQLPGQTSPSMCFTVLKKLWAIFHE